MTLNTSRHSSSESWRPGAPVSTPVEDVEIPRSPRRPLSMLKSAYRRIKSRASPASMVPEMMMGLPSPSHSKLGSFGSARKSVSRKKEYRTPGPGQYELKYAILARRPKT